MTRSLIYKDIVTDKEGMGEFCILAPSPPTGRFANTKDYIAIDLQKPNHLVVFNEDEVVKIDELEDDATPCPPIFDTKIPLMSKVAFGDPIQIGTVVAVNPIIIPINFECEYLIRLRHGRSVVMKSSDITVLPEEHP